MWRGNGGLRHAYRGGRSHGRCGCHFDRRCGWGRGRRGGDTGGTGRLRRLGALGGLSLFQVPGMAAENVRTRADAGDVGMVLGCFRCVAARGQQDNAQRQGHRCRRFQVPCHVHPLKNVPNAVTGLFCRFCRGGARGSVEKPWCAAHQAGPRGCGFYTPESRQYDGFTTLSWALISEMAPLRAIKCPLPWRQLRAAM